MGGNGRVRDRGQEKKGPKKDPLKKKNQPREGTIGGDWGKSLPAESPKVEKVRSRVLKEGGARGEMKRNCSGDCTAKILYKERDV